MTTTAPISRDFPVGRRVLTVNELSARWGTSGQHILDLIEEGKLQAIDIGGSTRRFWRIPFEATAAFEKRNSSLFDPASGQLLPENRTEAPSRCESRPNRRQCAAATGFVAGQTPQNASVKAGAS